ncbi:MAG: ABC transporter ATP-binding protein [Actinobacteria bacterium]|nr:ABC transporter ATP-binding protein [Actinomycetota bacterium]
MSSELRIEGIVGGYGDLTVLRDVSFAVEGGQLLVLAGPNGAGKTTLLSTVMGALKPSAGSVKLDGEELLGLPIHRRTRMGVGLVPEGRGLFPSLTVWENLRVAARAARLHSDQAEEGIERATAAFPIIGERLQQKVQSLSGGEQQMVAIGRALLTDPSVLLLDEPSMGLAPIIWHQVLDTCRRLADEGRVVVVVEQRVLEALRVADRCVVLQHGRVVRDGSVEAGSELPELAESYFSAEAAKP